MKSLIELAVLELNKLNKNKVYQINESDDPMIHVYNSTRKKTGGLIHKHIGTMKLSDANKKYQTNVHHTDVRAHNPLGIGVHVGSQNDLPHIPTPGRQEMNYTHASHPIEE